MSPTLGGKRGTQKNEDRVSHVPVVCMSLRTISSPNMMPAAEGMTHMIPNHVLRVGQTIRLDPTPETSQHDNCDDLDLDLSLENLNRIILELDPTFEPLCLDKSTPSTSPAAGRAWPHHPLSGHFLPPLTLFCLSPLLHKTKLHKQSEPRLCRGMTFTAAKPHSLLMKQPRSLGGLRSGLYFRARFVVLIPVVIAFSQLLWGYCSDRYHTLCRRRKSRSATGSEYGAGSSPRPSVNRICGQTSENISDNKDRKRGEMCE